MPGGYRAGTAFIAVTPSFRGFQIKAAAEAKKLRAIKVPIEYDTKNTVIPRPKPMRVPVQFDGGNFERKLQSHLRAALASLPDAQIGVATNEAEQKLKDLRAELQALSDQRIGVDLSAEQALAEAHRLQTELAKLSAESPNIQVHADTGAAAAELEVVQALANRLDGDKVNVNVDADTGAAESKLSALEARLKSMGSGGGRGTLIRVGVALAPAAAALGGLAAGAAGGLGALVAGVAGGGVAAAAVGLAAAKQAVDLNKKLVTATKARVTAMNAVKAASSSLAAAEASADQTQIQGARAVADAEEALAVARQNAARVAVDSEEQIKNAERQVAQANKTVAEAERQLHRARAQSIADLKAMRAEVHANLLEVEAAQFQAQDANAALADAEANIFSTSDDIARARLAAAQAEQQLGDARRKSSDSQQKLVNAEKHGTPAVIAAQKAVAAALQQRRDAVRSLADAERNAARARADAARSVADAERNLSRARADAATQNAAAARSVADAQRRQTQAEKKLSEAEKARQKILGAMTPMQHRVIAGINELHKAWHGFLLTLDKPLGGAILGALHVAQASLKPLAIFLRPVTRALQDVFGIFERMAKSPAIAQFSRVFGVFSGRVLRDAGKGTRNLVITLENLLRAFLPLGTSMSKGLLGMTRRARDWSNTIGQSKGFRSFISWVRKNGPLVLSTIGNLVKAIVAIGIALAPVGVIMIKAIGAFASWLTKMAQAHPQLIKIVGVVIALVAGLTAIAGPLAAVVTGFVFLLSPIGLVIAAVVAFAAVWTLAYTKLNWFRKAVDTWFGLIGKVTVWLWHKVIVPAFAGIGQAVSRAWRVIQPVLKAFSWFISKVLVPVVKFLWQNIIKPYFKLVGNWIRFIWTAFIHPILKTWWNYLHDFLFPIITGLWNVVVKPIFTNIGNKISTTWHDVIKPVFQALKGFISDTLVPAFQRGMTAIGEAWKSLEKLAAKPVAFLIGTVYDKGILKVLNALPFVKGSFPAIHGNMAGYSFDQGGYTGPGHRLKPAGVVHAGEVVFDQPAVKAAGGPRALDGFRRALKRGNAALPGYAGGGIVWRPTTGPYNAGYGVHDVGAMGPNSSAIDFDERVGTPVASVAAGRVTRSYDIRGYEPRRTLPQDGYRSYGRVIEINHGAYNTLYAHLSRRGVAAGTSVAGGQLIGLSGDTGNVTGAHLHFGAQNISPLAFLHGSTNYGGSVANAGAGGGGSFFDLGSVLKFLHLDQWKNTLGGMGAFGGMLGQMVGGIGGQLVSWVKDKAGSFVSAGLGNNGGTVQQIVQGLASRSGWGSGAEWSALSQLIASESSWNPTAQNPHSSAYGLFQFLNSTWATVGGHKTSDPNLQTQYGLRYIAKDYHDPIGAWNFHKAHGWYDQGGVGFGRGLMPKMTLRPERVLSPQQTESFDRLVNRLTYRGAHRLEPVGAGEYTAARRGQVAEFVLKDVNDQVIGRMRGIASGAVRGHHSFAGTARRAGMGEDW